jgi:ribosome-associated toxin RatA of RatAB toxin-antitoxin module
MSSRDGCLQDVTRLHPNRFAAILCVASALLGSPAAASAPVVVDVERDDDAFIIEASASLRADPATAWRILTDYGKYPRFIPGIRRSEVVGRRGAVVTVEQSDDELLWPLHWPLRITYEITELPPDRIESRAVARLMPTLRSHYRLTPTPAGVRLDYTGHVGGGLGTRDFEEWLIRRTVSRQFQALADEIERSGGNAATAPR